MLVLTAVCQQSKAQAPTPPVPTSATPSAPPDTNGAIIAFDQTVYNFGSSWAGEPVKHVFVVTNIGNAPLEISRVHPSCGCTTAGDYSTNIAPGKTGTIAIQFDNSHYNGLVSKTIDVFSNAKNTARAQLMLHGTVKKSMEITPLQAVITVQDDTTVPGTATVKIVNNRDTLVTLSDPVAANKKYIPELKTIKPGREYELTVSVEPPFTGPNAPGTIALKTSNPEQPTLTVSAITSIQKAVLVSPSQIVVGPPSDHWTTNRVFIRGNGPTHLALEEPQTSDSRIEVKIVPLGTPNLYNLVVAIPPNYQIPRGQHAAATLKSNHPRYPLITVPIVQSLRPQGLAGQPHYPVSPMVKQTATNSVAPAHP
ncbi:MAG TPA: DUF1573 domain-containing protein [Verrucomicrobiae bacterium]